MKYSRWKLNRITNHAKELENLGAKDGVEAYVTLLRIEKQAHKLAEDLHNIDVPDDIREEQEKEITLQVKKVFCGNLPNGFFINLGPRGYALKLDIEANNGTEFLTIHMGERLISYIDRGGYGILAPDFEV